ncbi:MAG TPA: FAD-dependent oxidoreductase [Gammaproteobacteria bacterium]|nr:FAD-dependent oxidoreductase [Gammaproteobacteria bacterium]
MSNPPLKLKYGQFQDLFNPEWLKQLDAKFIERLRAQNPLLYEDLLAYRHQSRPFAATAVSALLIACAPLLEEFIAELFNIEQELAASARATLSQQPIFAFKHWYVQRQARRRLLKQEAIPAFAELDNWLSAELKAHGESGDDRELAVAKLGEHYLQNQEQFAQQIEQLTCWCIRALTDPQGKAAVRGWVSFHLPQKLDYYRLVPMEQVADDPVGRIQGNPAHYRQRDGFKLTDSRMTPRQVLDEIDYCVYCHEKDGDFCSKGFPVKKGEPEKGFKINPLGEVQTGCPLEEKISEMHVLKKDGYTVAALAMIMVDNPMCPATGHRICNDCMKGCIYQKQDPVNIPQTETGILTDVLALPWGVEIYDLLTRWNPLRHAQWVAQPYNGLKVLVMGMGPAGFSLAHHLLMAGCAVVGVDGLKIEPLPEKLIHEPVYRFTDIKESLDTRVMAGFGGVAEYGITVRWDKNFLKLIYISLRRRPYFQVFGGVRFGGTLTVEDAWQLGFDHMAIAVGAGLPKALPVPGSMAPGMRQANDFLMALQLTGAAKQNSLANLQVRLPAVIIGGGLTGVDTATEVQAYYISQVEKTLARYEKLTAILGAARLREQFDDHSFEILDEFINHGRQVRQEREAAARANRAPDFISLIRAWGGVTIAYRRLLRESPAYIRNHEEVIKAFEEGIYYAEGLTPKVVRLDQYGHVDALVSESRIYDEQGQWVVSDEEHILPARSIFVATGAKPNIAYEFEHRGTFHREGTEYQAYDVNGQQEVIHPEGHCKTAEFGAFTSYHKAGRRVTFLGDTHPVFHGSVVKAIASAKRTYPKILHVLGAGVTAVGDVREYHSFAEKINYQFSSSVQKIIRHTPSVVELQVHAPLAVRNFLPGHFYRIQNFETFAAQSGDTLLQTEAIAVIGTRVDKAQGTLSLMVIEQGASSRIFATLKPGQPMAVMGPTGVRTKIPQDQETVLIVGGRLSAAQMLVLGPALRAAGNKVLYVAGFKTRDEIFCQEELERCADKIIWVTQYGEPVTVNRVEDRALTGDFMAALSRYAMGALDGGEPDIPLAKVNRVLVIGKHRLLRLMQTACHTVLKDYFTKDTKFQASVFGPMQCMLKGVCAQCLVWQIDPDTGKRTKAVFSCSWQDQPFELIDLENLEERLVQNRTQEILTNLWLDYLLVSGRIEGVISTLAT